MANLFPTSLAVAFGAVLPDLVLQVRSPADATHIRVTALWQCPKMRGGRLSFLLSETDMDTLRAFWAANVKQPIDFRYPWSEKHFGLYVGVGDGTTTVFDLPVYGSTARSIYVEGTLKTLTTHYTFASGTGANSRDRITFTTGNIPSAGQLISCNVTGYRQIAAVMADRLSAQELGPGLYRVDLTIDEV